MLRIPRLKCTLYSRCLTMLLLVLTSLPLAALADQDPFESVNRKIFAFNEFADRWVLKPVAKGYRAITPDFVDDGISNVFDNLGEVRNLVNAGLQGDFKHMAVATGRLLINSTVGIGGLIDVATEQGLAERQEDFGQTLATWGVESGPYLVVPFLGSSTLRDAPAGIVDWYTSPLAYIDDAATANSLRILDIIDTRADLIDTEALITGDRYVFIREVYLQQRESLVKNARAESNDADLFEDDDF